MSGNSVYVIASMSSVESIELPHLPEYTIFAALYEDVENASFLRQQLLAGNTDFEYAFLDASMVDHATCMRQTSLTYIIDSVSKSGRSCLLQSHK